MSASYQTPVENLPPVLPVERMVARVSLTSIYESGVHLRAQRHSFKDNPAPTDLDAILVSGNCGPVSADLSFTPGMIVHLANTMLTDSERGVIAFPLQGIGAP